MPKGTVSKVTRKTAGKVVAGKTAAATTLSATAVAPSTGDVARRAYEIYQAEGCPEGRHLDHWLQAESELLSN